VLDEIALPAFTGPQLRAARALLGWSTQRLAAESGVSLASIRRAECGAGSHQAIPAVAARLRTAIETAGVEFTAAEGSGPGVAFKKPCAASLQAGGSFGTRVRKASSSMPPSHAGS
jgi:transcriptional regulator with XRE-family HTH domain